MQKRVERYLQARANQQYVPPRIGMRGGEYEEYPKYGSGLVGGGLVGGKTKTKTKKTKKNTTTQKVKIHYPPAYASPYAPPGVVGYHRDGKPILESNVERGKEAAKSNPWFLYLSEVQKATGASRKELAQDPQVKKEYYKLKAQGAFE